MKIPGSIYLGMEGRVYLALYNMFPDVFRSPPPSAKDSHYIAHVDYSYESRRRGIDVFFLKSGVPYKEVDIKRFLSLPEVKVSYDEVDTRNDVKYELVGSYEHKSEVLNLIRKDILDFCENPAKRPTGPKINLVNVITPKTELRKVPQNWLLEGGKAEFVPVCRIEANLDFSYGCISGFVNGFLDIFAECNYCYALQKHKSFPKYIFDIDRTQLKSELLGSRSVKVLRLGKRTESGSNLTLDSLVLTLETCLETKTKCIMPTKYLKFDKEIAGLFKKTNSSLLFSPGPNKFERGACANGCNNEFRLEQAVRYKEEGVNSILYPIIELPHPPTKRDFEILKFAEKYRLPVQLLPIRPRSKEVALAITGVSWRTLKKSRNPKQIIIPGIQVEKEGGYISKASTLIAQEKDPFWINLVGNNKGNIRMCHHDEKETYCGACFLDKRGIIVPTQHVDIDYKRDKKESLRRRYIEELSLFS